MLMWDNLEKPWKRCFEIAWEAYCHGSFPIGAVVVNTKGDIISEGRSMQYENSPSSKYICGSNLAHAEVNALIQLNPSEHPEINDYTLYSTMEPCPLCFGAFIMSWIRNLKFAARDRYAGATDLNDKSEYIRSKACKILGPYEDLEKIQIAIQTDFVLGRQIERAKERAEKLIKAWQVDSPEGVRLGLELFETGELKRWKEEKRSIKFIYDELMTRLHF
ncbi:MAG TPA: nucleoside deaminase [Halanaerobiaceae bacterium]|jgi:tRNA(adenine34) deaminase|nr:nucleoside deaminase [Bacillota bacterium]HHU93405.1 nucleoside deaminase [Halanaerobiaceae bacterium]HOA39840.1 nucleoside deaminase [Halanaerobiales bacterium]HPZ62628.1 nucleoside deaminase [Halanaerobiales bacterium]HQD03897.1 nucleoside deaminase [Halanaerobiales bacterium]